MNNNEEIKKIVTEGDVKKILTDFVSNPYNQQEKVLNRNIWHTGKVVDNNDPDKLGRCRVRVYSIFGNDIPDDDIPWAKPDFTFIGSEVGSFVVPPVGCLVRCYFDNNDIYLPYYTTKAATSKLPVDKDEDYPNNMILFESDRGDVMSVNRSTGVVTFRHSTGSVISIDGDGNMEISSSNTLKIEATNDITISSQTGSIKLDAEKGYIDVGLGATRSIPNLPNDPVSGAPLAVCGQFPGVLGSARVKV